MSNHEYLIDCILPAREVHLLGGPSGAGKTRWLIPMLLDWYEGKDILGFRSYPTSWAYFASDRGMESVRRTFETMNIKPSDINLLAVWDKDLKWHEVLNAVETCAHEVVVIESFGSFIEGTATSYRVKHHIADAYRVIRRTGKTIIGIVEAPKQKGSPSDRYENPRQRISGAAAWAHFTETIMLVEPSDMGDPKCEGRQLYICPRNSGVIALDMYFDDNGHLRPSALNPADQSVG